MAGEPIFNVKSEDFPGLYQAADSASVRAQKIYLICLRCYLILLILAAFVAYYAGETFEYALLSASLFLATLGITIFLRVKKPDDLWYNGRAVAESVKTRAWRWMMRAEPYKDTDNYEIVSKQFISDLRQILDQNRTLVGDIGIETSAKEPISSTMEQIRSLSILERLEIYKRDRVIDQANWYASKSIHNRKLATFWFWSMVGLHSAAVLMLLWNIKTPKLHLPVEVIAVAASAVLSWLQAKKHRELTASYSLAAHEIVLIKGESVSIQKEGNLSDFIVNSENAFSREHTQWAARKID